jgi:hypothetical protein
MTTRALCTVIRDFYLFFCFPLVIHFFIKQIHIRVMMLF